MAMTDKWKSSIELSRIKLVLCDDSFSRTTELSQKLQQQSGKITWYMEIYFKRALRTSRIRQHSVPQ